MSTPEIIYLIPGEDIEGYPGMVWCESSAPSDHCDPDEAVKYVRADIHESALKRQGNAAKMGMDAAKKDAIWREENAKRLLAGSNPAAIESERAMNAELTSEVERLQARVADLEQAASVSEWIKCSERLPAERCLAFTPSDHPEIRYRIVPERILKALSEATHWMPLPKPPKQEQAQ